jgi:poly(3-hydroxybutyrate) depolymerase
MSLLYVPAVVLASCAALLAAGGAESAISRESVESRGERRTYYLLEPAGREPAPLVLLLHGTGGTGRELVERWSRLAGRERLILAAPASSDSVGWRVPRDGPDLFRDVVDAVAARRPIVRGRIYLVGYSAGGDAALFSSLAQSEYFAASAILAAALRPRQYPLIDLAARRIPIAVFAATLDAAYPLAEVRGTRDAFEARGFPIDYVELKGRDHGYVGASDDVVDRAWAFLRTHRLDGDPVYRLLDARLTAFALR